MSDNYEIHSLHINVGNGDGAVHLLVQPGAEDAKDVVHRAILVDGGKKTAVDQIQKTIKYVEDTYNIVGLDGTTLQVDDQFDAASTATDKPLQLKFDGIVVSRWAVDHSDGILALINQRLLQDVADPATPRKSVNTADTSKVKTLGPCAFMRYADDLTPLTNFYSAFWDGPTGASLVAKTPQATSQQPPPTSQFRLPPTSSTDSTPQKFKIGDANRVVDFVDSSDKTLIWPKVCNLVATPIELIGRELFTGQIATETDTTAQRYYKDVASLNTALSALPVKYTTGGSLTGICCIGADGTTVSAEASASGSTTEPAILKTSSVALVGVVGGVVKHYFAGDADYRDDNAAADWVGSSVPVVKLGNHGSVVSAPVDLVGKLKPSHFICSVGPSVDQLHPRWELLIYLKAWADADSGGKLRNPFFHPTSYPVYFAALDPTVTPQLELNFLPFSQNPTDDGIKRFQSALNNLDLEVISRIQDHTKSLDGKAKTKWAIDFLRNLWPFISYSAPDQHPIVGTKANNVSVSQQTQILFIMAQLTKGDPVISYVTGGRKTASKSTDSPTDPTALDAFQGYAAPSVGARAIPWFTADADRQDTAPGGVILQKPYPFNAPATVESTSTWEDEDDETPSANLALLVSDGAFPVVTTSTDTPMTPPAPGPSATYYFLGIPAYDKDTKGSDKEIVVSTDVNTFISGLGPGFIGAGDINGKLDAIHDLWGYYMSVSFMDTSVTIASTVSTTDPTTTSLTSVTLDCNLFAPQKTTNTLTFSTSHNEVQFNNASYTTVGAAIKNANVAIPDTGVVVCGLDPAATLSDITLSGLLTTFRFNLADENSTLKTMVNALETLDGKGVPLKLTLLASEPPATTNDSSATNSTATNAASTTDSKPPPVYRNAIWCFADTLYRFTIRLSFVIDESIDNTYVNSVASFLNTYLGISGLTAKVANDIAKVRFEVEMTGTYHPTKAYGYQVKTESVLRATFPINISSLDLVVTLTFSTAGFGIEIDSSAIGSASNLLKAAAGLTNNTDIQDAATWLTEDADVLGIGSLIPAPDNVWISKESGKMEYGITFLFDAFSNPQVRVGLSYSSAGVFTGALILSAASDNSQKLLPGYNIDADPENPEKGASSAPNPPLPLLITSVFGGGYTSLPNGLPDEISEAWVEYTRFDADDNQVRIFGQITSGTSTSDASTNNVPAVDVTNVSIAAQRRKKKGETPETSVTISTTIQMNALAGSDIPPAVLNVSLAYDSGDWIFHGRLESFQFSVLSDHFPDGLAHAFDDVLGKFLVRFVDITYTYETKTSAGSNPRKASSFFISGAIDFGGLELGLAYQYISDKPSGGSGKSAGEIVKANADAKSTEVLPSKQEPLSTSDIDTKNDQHAAWKFDAWLGTIPGTDATIGSVLDGIDSSISDILPDFVKSTPIPSADATPPPISIEVLTLGEPGKPSGIGFRAWLQLGDISMTFIQQSQRVGSSAAGSTPPPTQNPKRVLRISVATLPTATKIPLVNELPQPFDTLEYIWVSSPAPGTDGTENTAGGFTTAEVAELNDKLLGDSYPHILTKPLKSDDASKTGNTAGPAAAVAEIVLLSGHHFRVIHENEVILDYPFGQKQFPKPDPAPPASDPNAPAPPPETQAQKDADAAAAAAAEKAAATATTPDATTDQPVAKGKIGKTIGPLNISNVGIKLDDGFVWLTVDAMLTLGPLSFELIGFGVGFNLKKANKGLSKESIEGLAESLQIELHGMGLGFERPPITVAGVFMHDDVGGVSSYSGGVAVSFPPYTLVAVGEYDEVTVTGPPASKYKSVFVFAKLDGPLVELEFATIEGVRLGFGFNNIVVTPDLDNLTSFPFISDSALGTSNDPMKLLAAIQGTIQLQDGALWLAAGMKITAFDILSITAVALVEFSKAGCDISLFCDGMASMPPDAGPSLSIIYVEVVMIIELNVSQGFFRCEAALAPTSFILVPQCHLFGGFALCYWFGPSPYAGDFVFTIGGFHRSYSPPAHYPVPTRIGFACKMGSNLSVTGESYFAVTPTCCMGGGHLHVQIDVGPVSAYLDAFADFLITYKPFHYIADMGVDVGVTFDADFWIIHIHISCHVGAHLHIEGPEFGGSADVDFYLFSFTVYFGASPSPPPPLLLENVGTTNGFYQICKLPGPGSPPDDPKLQDSTADPQMTNLHITLEAGAYTQGSSKTAGSNEASNPPTNPATKWKVRAGTFRFRITCDFAIGSYTINNEAQQLAHGPKDPNPPAEADVFAFPMHNHVPITSDLTVTIVNEETLSIPAPTPANPQAVTHVPSPTGINPALTTGQLALIKNFDQAPFRPDFVIKSVPKALWSAYDPGMDPMASGATGLLAGNKTTPTVDLAMGITVGAPLPNLSKDGLNYAFNALDAMRASVFGDDNLYDPYIPGKGTAQTSWLPQPAPDNTAAKGWTEFHDAWTQSTELAPSGTDPGILALCMSALGWDKPPPEAKEADGNWVLNGALPTELTSGLGSYYLTLPQIAGAA